MAIRALILVEGHRANGPLYIQAAQRLGLQPITLSAHPAQYDYLAAEGIDAVRVDTNNQEALIRECSRLQATYNISGITGFTGFDESLYVTVANLCRHFDLPGPNPLSIERCCDKFTQHQLLAEAGVPTPAYRLAANVTEVKSFAAEIGLPVIVKPAKGSGSSGVRLCRDMDELTKHTSYLLGGEHMCPLSQKILVEEFADGPYYSTDTMGESLIAVGAAEFGPLPHFVVHECIFPASLTDDEYKRIADLSLSCLRALGLGWGPSNIEFRWTKRGPVVIEVNPRLPGWTTPRLIQLAYGADLVTEHIKLVTGQEWDLRATHSHVAVARNLIPDRDGILDWIDGVSHASAIAGVSEVKFYVKAKTPIVRRGDYLDSIGHVIAASPTNTRTKSIIRRAVDLIGWSITSNETSGER
ncbi:acetyl-CoA carboxylase biotin carboxylase subunit family protein (plasmid) [Rhizobium sp. CB3171]|uniref:ATP-grasp domain-containing protein n=1 Tax=Rhizobium sp. CB3171 TaxID=3039157 RepID=UPI0024B22B58|nr:acetyl-CoA carboxylase biotin carboxylase subunit family protein [Rhizobium sp. CB3171]WFU07100.1 acetyl-CoA carboxylase biotin carboxylase subunit family protein [Rhizobium sp. CB3171]